MLIFGHKLIKSPKFHILKDEKAEFKEGINCFEFDEILIEKALKMGAKFAIFAKNENEILLANALKAEFILLECENGKSENLAKTASKMAEFYLFDSKILLIVKSLKNLSKAYKLGTDGVILNALLNP